jgi:hypothetical protein
LGGITVVACFTVVACILTVAGILAVAGVFGISVLFVSNMLLLYILDCRMRCRLIGLYMYTLHFCRLKKLSRTPAL